MRVVRENLGGGLYRLNIVPTSCCENVERLPREVKDRVVSDAISRMRHEDRTHRPFGCGCSHTCVSNPCHCGRVESELTPKRRSYSELDRLKRCGEPDGIDVHVDRPLIENFRSRSEWALAMAKYRTLEDVAKDCDWECREPMKGTDFYRSQPTVCSVWVDEDEWDNDFDWFDNDDDDWDEWSCLQGRY